MIHRLGGGLVYMIFLPSECGHGQVLFQLLFLSLFEQLLEPFLEGCKKLDNVVTIGEPDLP